MKTLVLLLVIASYLPTEAQKNVVPAGESKLTGIKLPSGSKQDKRFGSVFKASSLMTSQLTEYEFTFETIEVFKISTGASPLSYDSLVGRLQRKGWKENWKSVDGKLTWVTKDQVHVAVYFAVNAKDTDLYFGKAQKEPVKKINEQNVVAPVVVTADEEKNTVTNNTPTPSNESQSGSKSVSLTGTWYTVSSIGGYMTQAYRKRQFTFATDGSYAFYAKTFDISMTYIILRRENGKYIYQGNKLVLMPGTTVVETWSKKDGADQWGKKLSSEVQPSENTTYEAIMHYFQGTGKWNLILQPADRKQTKREGTFASNVDFPDSYMYEVPPDNSYLIELP